MIFVENVWRRKRNEYLYKKNMNYGK